jgi:hypothetical protein
MTLFQQTVNIYNTLGYPGGLAFTGPIRSIGANINSSGTPNNFGYAYTFTSAATAEPALASPNGAVATVGGTGVFAGILFNPKENVLNGTTGNPLGATLALADNSVGDLLQMGYVFVNLPGVANPGDLVTYDPATGALNSIVPTSTFTASIAAGGSAGVLDVMTVSAITAGSIQVGALVQGSNTAGGTYVASLGTGLGGVGTYNLTSVNEQTVTSAALTCNNLPEPAFVGLASFATSVMTVNTATSGELVIGQQVFGTGVPANTVIISYGTGAGGTGTYNLNNTVGTLSNRAITAPGNLFVPRAVVERYATNTSGGGVAVIKLTN